MKVDTCIFSLASLLFLLLGLQGAECFTIEPPSTAAFQKRCNAKSLLFLHPNQANELVNAAEAELKVFTTQEDHHSVDTMKEKKRADKQKQKKSSILSFLFPVKHNKTS
mmetsp:Transcript_9777/g.14133  ORF Transcript_9777/g.14133 Transcript_9777/m.14133 type:complete len:109 (-) Transcript_9777:1932-2258(-)